MPRLIAPRIKEALEDTSVIFIQGPRQSGKSTVVNMVVPEYKVVDFDRFAAREAAMFDPTGYIEDLPDHSVLDEVQRVPEIFLSIKEKVDKDRAGVRMILTGSTNASVLPQLSDALVGRMEIINLWPFSQSEIEQRKGLLTQLLRKRSKVTFDKADTDIEASLLTGGFPEPVYRQNEASRQRWFENYQTTLLQKDLLELSKIRNTIVMPKLLEMMAYRNAKLLKISEISKALKISRRTLEDYIRLLSQLFLIDILRPWHSNGSKRLIKSPKVHFIDTGLVANILGMNSENLAKNRELFGTILETYVYNELKRQSSGEQESINFYHFRDREKNEVDIVIERADKTLFGIEVKAAKTVFAKDFKGLRIFQEIAGDKFVSGIILYSGNDVLPFGKDFMAVPLKFL